MGQRRGRLPQLEIIVGMCCRISKGCRYAVKRIDQWGTVIGRSQPDTRGIYRILYIVEFANLERDIFRAEDLEPALCQCGCGHAVGMARKGRASRGQRKGEPIRCLPGHRTQLRLRESLRCRAGHLLSRYLCQRGGKDRCRECLRLANVRYQVRKRGAT